MEELVFFRVGEWVKKKLRKCMKKNGENKERINNILVPKVWPINLISPTNLKTEGIKRHEAFISRIIFVVVKCLKLICCL